ncbi:MAG: AtpZ/AtpI family protein [Rhodospirillales bacterium]
MSDHKPDRELEALDARLRRARGETAAEPGAGALQGSPKSALGLAFRVGVELVSALAIGVGVGWLLDSWLGTRPWLMLVFILLGGAAGILNVYRTARGFGYAVGYRQQNEPGDDHPGDRGSGIEG